MPKVKYSLAAILEVMCHIALLGRTLEEASTGGPWQKHTQSSHCQKWTNQYETYVRHRVTGAVSVWETEIGWLENNSLERVA